QFRRGESNGTLLHSDDSGLTSLPDEIAAYVAACDQFAMTEDAHNPMRAVIRFRAAVALHNYGQHRAASVRFQQLALDYPPPEDADSDDSPIDPFSAVPPEAGIGWKSAVLAFVTKEDHGGAFLDAVLSHPVYGPLIRRAP